MAKTHTKFVCQACGFESPKWLGKCPDCDAWASFVEEMVQEDKNKGKKGAAAGAYSSAIPITELTPGGASRNSTGLSEFDRVLGGGVVDGSLVLIGGDPGIGKSTILIQVANHLSKASGRVLYVTGEESAEQIKLRSNRLGLSSPDLLVAAEGNIRAIDHYISEHSPRFVIVDSIQAMHDPELSSASGTVSQVRGCTAVLASLAKNTGVPFFIVGHVTKEGALAGPRVLEHMVDTVLYFEGERRQSFRILRAVKNRFGSTDEIGVFEMREEGLVEVANPSEALLAERPVHHPGSMVTSTVEGTRPILVEVQALVAPSYFPSPRRSCTGFDYNRMSMILAILEKRVGMALGNKDVYVNVAGGVRIIEPAADLAIALAIASSLTDQPVDPATIAVGEIGLSGEIRIVGQTDKRLKEAARMGFERAIMAESSAKKAAKVDGIKTIGTPTLRSAIEAALSS